MLYVLQQCCLALHSACVNFRFVCRGCRRGQQRPAVVPTVISGKLGKEFVGQAACGWKHSAALAGGSTPISIQHVRPCSRIPYGGMEDLFSCRGKLPLLCSLWLRDYQPHAACAPPLTHPIRWNGRPILMPRQTFSCWWHGGREQAFHLGMGRLHGVPCH